jgi:glycerophosphoryl diester phosphodiesterase
MRLTGPVRHPFLDYPGPLPFAHRGGASEWPENTMPAFAGAVGLGYDFHDNDLARTCRQPGRISDLGYAAVAEARVEGREPIPLMQDLFDAFPDVRFNIDCKSDAAVEPLITCLRRNNALERVCIGGFSHTRLVRLRKALGPELCTSMSPLEVARWRLGRPPKDVPCAQVPVSQGPAKIVTRPMVDLAHRHGIAVHVWTIDLPEEMFSLLELGVDGLMTDRPAILKQVLTQRGEWAGRA